MASVWLALAMVMLGVTCVLSQVLGLREFVLLARGNELSIGIVLGNWLLAAGLGSGLAGRRSSRSGNPLAAFVSLQILVSILLPATLVLIRISRHILGISPWEALGFSWIAWTSLLFLGPVAMGGGAMFAFGCRLLEDQRNLTHEAPGTAYALEAVGAVLGGVLFSYLLVGRLHSIQIAICLGVFNLISSLGLLVFLERTSRLRGFLPLLREDRKAQAALAILLVSGILLGSSLADGIQKWTHQVRWKPLGLKESTDSIYGNITVLKLGDQTIFYQNGIPSITTPVPDLADLEQRVHLPLLAHADPREVLFIGGGVGGALAEALKHPVRRLTYAEMDPTLIRTVERQSSSLVRSELSDPRTEVVYEDGRFFLRRTLERYDGILVLLPDASTLQLNRFFTTEFFELARSRLNPQGVFSFSLPGSAAYLNEPLLLLNRCAQETLKQVFPFVRVFPGERNLFVASSAPDLGFLTPEMVEKRLLDRRIETGTLGTSSLQYQMDPSREQWVRKELEKVHHPRLNRDLLPALVHYFLAYQRAESEGGVREGFWILGRLSPRWLFIGVLLLCLSLLPRILLGKRRRGLVLSFSIFTTGIAGMTVEMVGILLFQSLYGYLYHWIGLMIAVFMAGLAAGAHLINRNLRRMQNAYRVLLVVDGLLFSYLLLLALGLLPLEGPLLSGGDPPGFPRLLFVALMVFAGMLVGAEFPLAVKESPQIEETQLSGRAGWLYALDLAGAFLGTLLVGVVLVPWIGVPQTLLAAAVLKAVSLSYLWLGR